MNGLLLSRSVRHTLAGSHAELRLKPSRRRHWCPPHSQPPVCASASIGR
jgi:hypothetical protein